MSTDEATQAGLDRRALEAFVVGNGDLERLEALLDTFNIFEAIGMVHQEVRHSNFLAFLLDPKAAHGLGDAFAKRLLQRAIAASGATDTPVTPIELELWDLGRMEVRREWQRIDILLLDEEHKLAAIIENKIHSGEHSDQLRRYRETVGSHHPGWRVIGLYLTPGGDSPSDEENYLPVGYGVVRDVIDGLAESRASVVSPDLMILMKHYTEMLRRHIVGDSEIARLSRQIYRKHKRALDLIYEHRHGAQAAMNKVVEALVKDEPGLELDSRAFGDFIVRFAVPAWDATPMVTAQSWTKSSRILLFEFWNQLDSLEIKLFVGPGSEEVRQKLFDMARANPDVFEAPHSLQPGGSPWHQIFSRQLLNQGMYEEWSDLELETEVRKRWAEFLTEDLPRIDSALKQEEWVWAPAESDDPA